MASKIPIIPAESKKSFTGQVARVVQNHYTATPPVKTPEQIFREAWLIPGVIPFSRWYCMPAAFIIQFACGSLYSWSVFNKPIDILIFGSVANMAPITFYMGIAFLGISAAIMGPWLERNGPRTASILGGSFFCLGNLITALALYCRQISLVYLGYGFIAAFGIGVCYISPVSALQKWFPDRRGLASGIAVSGFGAGSIASAKLQVFLMANYGLPMTFIILGCSYTVFIFLAGLVLRTPPPGYSPTAPSSAEGQEKSDLHDDTSSITLIEALRSMDFKLTYVAFFSNILFGLVAISRLSNMITDIFGETSDHASTIVAINGGFNLFGRIFFSLMSDYIGRKNVYICMLSIQILILISFYFVTTFKCCWLFLTIMWLISACYGGGFASIPAFLTDKFGQYNVGATHGVILTAWSLAGIFGGIVFTSVFKIASECRENSDPFPYYVNTWWILGLVTNGWLALVFVRPTARDLSFYRILGLSCGDNEVLHSNKKSSTVGKHP